ncbi:MAG: hypothetical protein FWD57_15065, partial [Polyangiaceae bacterium]|nr:hypothetical protein [Polyangiaceae bacterium]
MRDTLAVTRDGDRMGAGRHVSINSRPERRDEDSLRNRRTGWRGLAPPEPQLRVNAEEPCRARCSSIECTPSAV